MPPENHTVKPSFIIHTQEGVAGKHLFVFAANKGITFIALQKEENIITDVLVYPAPTGLLEKDLQQMLTDTFFLQQSFSKVDIVWGVKESIIVPHTFFNKEKCSDMLNLVYGSAGKWQVLSELMITQNAYNIYKVDEAILKIVLQKFPTALQSHQSTAMVNFMPAEKDLLYCSFYSGWLTVLLRKDSQLQVIQNFEYAEPEDAAYHLLNVCKQFHLNATETVIYASGMIEENSNLHREVYKYFAAINFFSLPEHFLYAEEISNLPQQYFSHFISVASCVS